MRRPCTAETSSAARMGSVATLDSLHALRIPTRCDTASQLRLHRVGRGEASRREQAGGRNRTGDQEANGHEGPTQRTPAQLVFHIGAAASPPPREEPLLRDTPGDDK